MKLTIHPKADKIIAQLEEEGHTITSVISCHNYTRIITNFSNVHVHH